MFNNYKKPDSKHTPSSFADPSSLDDWASAAPTPSPAPTPMGGSMFGTPEAAGNSYEPAPAMDNAGSAASHNVLGSDVSVVGTLRFTENLIVDGSVEGEITSDGELTVGTNATIQAGSSDTVAIRTKSAIIQGKVTGDINVTDRVELTSTAELIGDVTAATISIQEGAVFIGHCRVGASTTPIPAAPTATKKSKAASKSSDTNLLG